jgi:8-oxo-dGTP pyrophosphatase MutT (NUDIX family)
VPLPDHVRRIREKVGTDLLLLPAVAAVVVREDGHVLLGQRSDNGRWAIVGGILEPEEPLVDALVREVQEETAVLCRPVRISGVYLSPVVAYPSTGDLAQYVVTTFLAEYVSGEARVNDDESLAVGWFPPDALPDGPDGLGPSHRQRVLDALSGDAAAAF